jgi:hypothetical protein
MYILGNSASLLLLLQVYEMEKKINFLATITLSLDRFEHKAITHGYIINILFPESFGAKM